MKRKRIQSRKGFSLIELMVVLVIIGVLAAVGIPSAVNYIKLSDFRENEANAKTVYMAAESSLTWYRNSGQWDAFKDEVLLKGEQNDTIPAGDKAYGRIYAITLDNDGNIDEENPVYKLLSDAASDKSFLNAAIAIEIDMDTGQVYSAFYSTGCIKLMYKNGDEQLPEGAVSISMGDDRSYDNRKEHALGYYSVEDVTNVVALEPTRLKVTSINLQNNETLALSWSSNSRHDNRDIIFHIKIKTGDEVLFSTKLNRVDLESFGWNKTTEMAGLELLNKAEEAKGKWDFPLTYKDGTFTLVLDGMMSAQMLGGLEAGVSGLDQTSNISITRLAAVANALGTSQDIYATISASPDYTKMGEDSREYRNSSEVKSNTENTLFDKTTAGKAYITKYRHLSNIRYVDEAVVTEFVLDESRMNWTSEETGYFDLQTVQTVSRNAIQVPVWQSVSKGEASDFPMIDVLHANHTLTGNGTKTLLMNLKLGEKSILNDLQAEALNIPKTQYLGLFGVVEGSISNVVLKEPKLTLKEESTSPYAHLEGVGLLCGMNHGSLSQITIDSSRDTMNVVFRDRTTAEDAAVGGIAGVLSKNAKPVTWLVMNGDIQVHLPLSNAGVSEQGIGGIFGYGEVITAQTIQNCNNYANVTGNLYTGGICGQLKFTGAGKSGSDINNCYNTGLILCDSSYAADAEEGKYFGGIVGGGKNIQIEKSVNASGKNRNYKYKLADKDLLRGQYVGGVLGYGEDSTIIDCNTEMGAYILGSDYVGGILGGVNGLAGQVIQATGNNMTVNSGYVIGQNYVGGILGKNTVGSTITKCLNNGVAVGYGEYIGGLAGYNESGAVIDKCASYISDHDNSIFNMIVGWGATGDYTGGLVGYNDGTINFSADAPESTRTISSIAIGKNYVGGITGFNAENGVISGAEYARISGDVYAFGNAAGGVAGVNTAEELLSYKLLVQPRSVRGKYYVGGIIGANIVDLQKDTSIEEFEARNGLGTIKGEAFVGGVIGYHRTYMQAQLNGKTVQQYLLNPADGQVLLPDLNADEKMLNIPQKVLESENTKVLTITRKGNKNDSLEYANNDVSIQAYLYAGGIIGYCEEESRLVLVNCLNRGRLSLPDTKDFPDSQAAKKVELKAFLRDYLSEHSKADVDNILSKIESEQWVTMIGGIAGVNMEKQVIDHCANTGSISGFTALGGIVGTNAGRVFNCTLSDNLGSLSSDGIGGIAGINLYPLTSLDEIYTYTDCNNITWNGVNAGTIAACISQEGKFIRGKNNVGGIAGYNLYGAVLRDNISLASVGAQGNNVGGQAGINVGSIYVSADPGGARKIESSGGNNVGGIVGLNEASGSIQVTGAADSPVIGNGVEVVGNTYVGGIVGLNKGAVKQTSGSLICAAKKVSAKSGNAGGIAGRSEGQNSDINNAVNRCILVTADYGNVGGIVAEAQKGITISNCQSYGEVLSNNGYAGGIVSVNSGTVSGCSVEGKIQSGKTKEIGAICGKNTSDGVIENSAPTKNVTLSGDAAVIGAVTGLNEGTIKTLTISYMPTVSISGKNLIIGGVAGSNAGTIGADAKNDIKVAIKFGNEFGSTYYLGGVAGENKAGGIIKNSTYAQIDKGIGIGELQDSKRVFGNKQGACYGGIAGYNGGTLSNCTINGVTFEIKGVYTATSISSAEQKEAYASHVGGIAGKNDNGAKIEYCYLDNSKSSKITVDSGMAGAITGYNKGVIQFSGDAKTADIMGNETAPTGNINVLYNKATASVANGGAAMSADTNYVKWTNGSTIENLQYSGTNTVVSAERDLVMQMLSNGNLGGITAYNAPTGVVAYCATGDWFLNNKSEAIGVGTGGIIGMNESVQDLSFLVNQAFVGRQTGSNQTNRFAGGIIGNQNVSQSSDWKLSSCINFGTIYGYRTHYSGGILGQWTSAGGTIENCRNYGNLQTTFSSGYQGAAAGIVAQLYHPYEDNEYNIISSSNHGDIYGQTGKSNSNAANDSAGILGNVTTYGVGSTESNYVKSQNFTIQILDCVNDAGVEIYSTSMASGILGFISCDDHQSGAAIRPSSMYMVLRIERCRNFAKVLNGANYVGGILGDRYGVIVSGANGTDGKRGFADTTIVKDCYSVVSSQYNKTNFPMGSLNNSGNSITGATAERNYFFADSNLTATNNVITSTRATISNGTVSSGGKTLFNIIESGKNYNSISVITGDNSTFDKNVRESYRSLEGVKTNAAGEKYLPSPEVKAVIDKDNGKLLLTITPTENSNPFKYTVKVYLNDEEKVSSILYTNNANISLPKELTANERALKVQVTAHSMFDDVRSSEPVVAEITEPVRLPVPDIKVELVKSGNSYQYRYSLNNAEAYDQIKDLDKQWAVNISFSDSGDAVRLTSETPTFSRNGFVTIAQQLLVQAVTDVEVYLSSEQISVPAYLPSTYLPQADLSAAYQVKGTTLDDLEIAVTLTYDATCDIPPLYRCDLIGTWNGKQDVTLASTDILIAAQGEATGTLANLPDYITQAENLRLRIWCSEYGLGPVYTYTDLPMEQAANANVQILTFDTEGNEVWQYQHTPVLSDNTFKNYRSTTNTIITWLPAPSLKDVADGKGPRLEPSYNTDTGRLEYTFVWDENIRNGTYRISLTGKYGENEVSIKNNVQLTGGTYTIDAEDWTYEQVELTVTRIGNTSNGAKEIGFTSSGIYDVSKRLSKPEQPTVTNKDVSELDYKIEWVPIAEDQGTDEDGCGSYIIYLQKYKDDGSEDGKAEVLGEVPAKGGESGLYQAIVDLEKYQGDRVQIYLVAKADTENYVNSAMGVTHEIEIPTRIKLPRILEWIKNWFYDLNQKEASAQTVEQFENGGMDMRIAVGEEDVPQGGSSYLVRAYVYDSQENAQAAITAVNNAQDITDAVTGLLYSYSQIQMEEIGTNDVNQYIYRHALQGLSSDYAGKWVVFQTRISASSGQISSNWVASDVIQLPFVKLDAPSTSTYVERLLQNVNVTTNPDQPKVVQDWQAEHYVCYFDSVRNAETYYITLYPRDIQQKEITYRIQETGTASGGLEVFVKTVQAAEGETVGTTEWAPVTVTVGEDGTCTAVLPDFKRNIQGVYTGIQGVPFYYDTILETGLRAVPKEGGGFQYTLSVPDITTLVTEDGMTLPNTAVGMTALIKINCDVNANDTLNGITGGSLSYIGSDVVEINLNE